MRRAPVLDERRPRVPAHPPVERLHVPAALLARLHGVAALSHLLGARRTRSWAVRLPQNGQRMRVKPHAPPQTWQARRQRPSSPRSANPGGAPQNGQTPRSHGPSRANGRHSAEVGVERRAQRRGRDEGQDVVGEPSRSRSDSDASLPFWAGGPQGRPRHHPRRAPGAQASRRHADRCEEIEAAPSRSSSASGVIRGDASASRGIPRSHRSRHSGALQRRTATRPGGQRAHAARRSAYGARGSPNVGRRASRSRHSSHSVWDTLTSRRHDTRRGSGTPEPLVTIRGGPVLTTPVAPRR